MAQLERGTLVRFNHERDGGPVRRIASVAPDGMVELEDMGGFFAPHLFEIADDIGDIPPKVSTEMSEDFSKATPRPWRFEYGDSFDHGEDGEENGFEILMAGENPRATGRCQVVHRIRYAEDVFPEDTGYAEAEANARLIVAAVNAYRDPRIKSEETEADVERVTQGARTMTKPSEWAQELASHMFLCMLDRDTRRHIAFAIDGARREALEEAAQIADSFTCGSCGMDGKSGVAIRALRERRDG